MNTTCRVCSRLVEDLFLLAEYSARALFHSSLPGIPHENNQSSFPQRECASTK